MEAKVEDFVAGATEEPTLPTPEPSPAESAPPAADPPTAPLIEPTAPAPEPPPADTATAVADDKLIADAAEALVNSTEKPAAETITPTVAPAIQVAAPSALTTPPEDEEAKPPADGRNKKIIKPLDAEPKTDINTLLALEEAKEANKQGTPAAAPVIAADDPKAPQASAPPNPVITPPANPDDVPSGVAQSPTAPAAAPPNPADPDSIAL